MKLTECIKARPCKAHCKCSSSATTKAGAVVERRPGYLKEAFFKGRPHLGTVPTISSDKDDKPGNKHKNNSKKEWKAWNFLI